MQRWIATVAALGFAVGAANAQEADRLPNVLVTMGDDYRPVEHQRLHDGA